MQASCTWAAVSRNCQTICHKTSKYILWERHMNLCSWRASAKCRDIHNRNDGRRNLRIVFYRRLRCFCLGSESSSSRYDMETARLALRLWIYVCTQTLTLYYFAKILSKNIIMQKILEARGTSINELQNVSAIAFLGGISRTGGSISGIKFYSFLHFFFILICPYWYLLL